ncbi:MAG: type III-A CRISPR-associated RAMP protein Csm3 [Bacteroidota bacterium]
MPTTPTKQLKKKIFFRGRIRTLTGLHIGGSNNRIDIGGVDNVVIRNPVDDKPYIPGSSFKGKMRSLMEQMYGKDFDKGIGKSDFGIISDPKHELVRLFGNAKTEEKEQKQNVPSRLIVRDGRLLTEGLEAITDIPYTELKTEVTIDRITASATPRQLERVPAGVEFDLQLVLNIWEDGEMQINSDDDRAKKNTSLPIELSETELVQMVFNGLRLVQDDCLGGNGSRGSGQVQIGLASIEERSNAYYLDFSGSAGAGYETSTHQIPEDLKLWDIS